jgi:hypothetical protein
VSAAELASARGVLRDDAPEPVVCLFVAKASDVEGASGLLGSRTKLADAFLTVAAAQRAGFTFVWSADAEAAAAAGVKPGTLAVLHSPLLAGGKSEPAAVPYTGAADAGAMTAWLWAAALPAVGELTARTAPLYEKTGLPLVRVALPTDWRADAKGAKYWLNRLRRVAATRPTLRFATVKPSSPLAALSEYGVESADAKFAVTITHNGAKFAMGGAWSPTDPIASITPFLDAYEGGALEPFVKSEPIPEGLANGVTVVVGKTFDALVLDDTKGESKSPSLVNACARCASAGAYPRALR